MPFLSYSAPIVLSMPSETSLQPPCLCLGRFRLDKCSCLGLVVSLQRWLCELREPL
ncbi:hypothetical protein CPB84DRAFT_1786719 [Gymnopilus junonius]|uniref:Uncharacterized protein n=1 Tax=Gymnopilus junonius TaxID=109634 RepID=A0A9P5NFL3_GYMJU|nr:hypothetical protein CPB84DRAFT_1786719 [Gymnopilus junonius]